MLDIGLPGAGPRAVAHCEALGREIGRARLKIKPNCAARTHENDIRPIAEIVQRTGVPIEAATFIGSSPIRRYTEDWTDDFLLRTTENAVKFAISLGLDVMYVTEDTTRCDPETIKRHLHHGDQLRRQGHCDLRHRGTRNSDGRGRADAVRDERSGEARRALNIRVEWHGHCDRGLAVANSLAAYVAGAEVVHATACRHRRARWQHPDGPDAGEPEAHGRSSRGRARTSPNSKEYCEAVAKATGVPIPKNYPVVGDDAFRTGTGVHAAAVIKAYRKNDVDAGEQHLLRRALALSSAWSRSSRSVR